MHGHPNNSNPTIDTPISIDGRPVLGERYVVPARQGRAVLLKRGQSLTIINTYGSQVCDFWAVAADNDLEVLSMPHLHGVLSNITPKVGDKLVSNFRRALFSLVEDTSPGVHDTVVAACDVYRYQSLGVTNYHDNCSDNFRMALSAIGRTAPQVPAPFNIWMNTPVRADGSIDWLPTVSRLGDRVVLRAEADVVAVMSACPQDMVPINGADNTPRDLAFLVQ